MRGAFEAGGRDPDARAGDDPAAERRDGSPRRLDRDPPHPKEVAGLGDRGALADQQDGGGIRGVSV